MRLMLDSHALLWFAADDPRLSATARSFIRDPRNERLFSIASVWELAIKVSLGKLSIAEPFETFVPRQLSGNLTTLLPIELRHINRLLSIPLHHRDPFDRLLVAQALVEQVGVVSADPAFDAYGVTRYW